MIEGIKLTDLKFGSIINCRSNIPYQFNQYDTIEFQDLKLVMIFDKSRDILRDKLIKLYSEYQPDKLPVVDTVIDQWEMSKLSGDNLLEILNQRYCNIKIQTENNTTEKSFSILEEKEEEEEEESVTLDTISLSPIKLSVHQPNTEDSQSQQQSQSQPLLLSQQEISLNTPLIIGNSEKENNLFYNRNGIANTSTKLRKRLDENMRGIDTPIINNNENKITSISAEEKIVRNEEIENKNEENGMLNNSSKSTIDDISDIVTFVNIKQNNNNNNNNNEKSPELNSFNKQMTNFSTPSPINITNATSDTSNISTPIILLNGQISDNNNNNNNNPIYNESFSSLTTPSPIKTNISLIKSFDSSATTTPIPIIKCNNKMEEGEKDINTDIKEAEIIKREPIERMLEMSIEDDDNNNNNIDESTMQNENEKENECSCNSDIIVNTNILENKDNDIKEEEEKSKQKENEKADKIEGEEKELKNDKKEMEKEINEEEKQNEQNKIEEERIENKVKVEKENDENININPKYEVTVRKTRGMIKREEEEEEERRKKEVEESKEVTTTTTTTRKTTQSKSRNNKRKTVSTKRYTRSRKVKETENDEENNENNDKKEEDKINNTPQKMVENIKDQKEKPTQKETTKIEVKEEVVKLENEINEELLASQVYGKSTDEKEEEEEEDSNNNTPQRKRRISSNGSIDNSSPTKKLKDSPITKSKRRRSSESPSVVAADATEIKRRKLSVNSDYHIAITGLEKDEYEPIVKSLGGKFENDITKATHLLVKNLKRTLKLMYAMCCCDIHILSVKWLSDSKRKGHFVSEKTYVPSDPKTEKEYHYHFINSYVARNTRLKPLFDGYNFYLTPNVIPPINELIKLIKKGGGKVISNIRDINRYEGDTLMIADENDIDQIPKEYQERVYSTQLIICSIMEQKVDTESHLIVNSS